VGTSKGSRLIDVAVPVALLVGPVLLALFLAYGMARHDLETRAQVFADVVLDQASRTTDQLRAAYAELERPQPNLPCSPASLATMRQLDLGSSLLQGVGYVEGDQLMCSSMADVGPTAIAPPDYISAYGFHVRIDRQLSYAPNARLLMISAPSGYTGFVHPDLIFALTPGPEAGAFGVVSQQSRTKLISRGTFDFDWSTLALPDRQSQGIVTHGTSLLAWQRRPGEDFISYAALPLADLDATFAQLGPAAAGLGGLFGLALLWLRSRLRHTRGSLPNLLRAGLRRREISIVYQPLIDIRSGTPIGIEALARWQSADGEAISPDIFVPIAEKHGLMDLLTDYVVTEAIAEAAPLLRTYPSLFLCINVSSADIERPALLDVLESTLRRHVLRPQRIHIEITERERVDPGAGASAIATLQGRGYVVGTDDFGVGYSNLHYLDSLTLDFLKIDRALLCNAFGPGGRPDLVDHIIELARSRNIEVVAEGIETIEQRDALLARGIVRGQGWLFYRAMRTDELRRVLGSTIGAPPPAESSVTGVAA
jgi:sensor c-di-GMP phosphodiesterase-like protein